MWRIILALWLVLAPAWADGISVPGVPRIGGDAAFSYPPTVSGGGSVAITAVSDNAGATIQTNGSGIATFSAINFGTAATDRLILVGVSCACGGASGNDTAMTIGGVTATLAVASSGSVVGLNGRFAEWWYASVPTGTSGNIVITNPNNFVFLGVVVYAITGATTTPTITVAHQDAVSGALPQTLPSVTVPTSGAGVALIYNDTVTTSPAWTTGTGDFSFNNGGGAYAALEMDSAHTASSGAIAFKLGGTGGNNWAGVAITFAP